MKNIFKSRKALVLMTVVFLCVEFFLSVFLQLASGRAVAASSFISIILACLFCFVSCEKSYEYAFTQIALVCTVCADYFLVWSSPIVQLPAMVFFLVAQLMYASRLYLLAGKCERYAQIISRAALSVIIVAVTVLVLKENTDALAIVSMLYYANLILNAVFAFCNFRCRKLLAIGFLLFILCDTVIGLEMMNAYLPIPKDAYLYKIIRPGFNLAWVFYLPSQVALSLSMMPKKLKKSK